MYDHDRDEKLSFALHILHFQLLVEYLFQLLITTKKRTAKKI